MKKICFFLSLCFMSYFAMAQYGESDLKPFKVDVSAGYALPAGSGSKGGVLLVVEPKYAVMSNLSLGLRMEIAIVARFSGYDANGNPLDLSVKGSGGYLATADYYFTDNYSFRPFVGAGAGIFTLASAESSGAGSAIATGAKFGGMIRGGIEAGHFRFGIEYNLIPKSTLNGYDVNGDPAKISSKNSYLGIKVGVCFGGGPRE
jgi:outer membrane protein X